MRANRILSATVALAFAALPAAAQERGIFTASALGGVVGAFDSEGAERRFDHTALQLSFSVLTAERTRTAVRVGSFDFGDEPLVAGATDATVEYVTLAGEAWFRESAYEFAFFVGVGGYRREAELPAFGSTTEEAFGAVAGVAGDFDLTRRWSIVAELDLHYVFFDEANFYGSALAGVAVHF